MTDHALIAHRSGAPQLAALAVVARVDGSQTSLRFEYRLMGEIARVAVPRRSPSRAADKLWEHTCFEAFVATGAGSGYYELNFSPSTEWAAYAFDDYRQGMRPLALARPPRIVVAESASELRVTASVEIDALAAAPWPWHVGLAAVVEDRAGNRGYFALRHPRDTPDFHDAASFAVLQDGSAR